MQEITMWTAVQLVVFVLVWILIFSIGYLIMVWAAKRKARKMTKK